MRDVEEAEKSLMVTGWFPFDTREYFAVAYLFQLQIAIIGGLFLVALDSLIISLIMVAPLRLKVLANYFRHFGDKKSMNSLLSLKNLISEHQGIIRYVEDLNASLKWLFLADFVVKSYNISIVLSNAVSIYEFRNIVIIIYYVLQTRGRNKSELAFSALFLCFLLSQLYCFYFHANEILLESTNLAENIFKSKWYEQNSQIKRSLIIVMIRSQKPLQITIGDLHAIENILFVKIVKAAYTFLLFQYLGL
uniref:Odorant receptor OR20 n=1 Tax=Colaphellus bowringi TaxID=561076 RepID=A0A0S3J2T6_9CUCU|nr:odorant receptor OR20 [Colaphellus bowringi]